MLTRATPHNASQHVSQQLTQCLAQLQLPWLCPALLNSVSRRPPHIRAARTQSTRARDVSPIKPPNSRARRSSPSSSIRYRHLATAVGPVHRDDASFEDFVPFEGAVSSVEPQSRQRSHPDLDTSSSRLSEVRPFDPTNLIAPSNIRTNVPKFRRGKNAIPADVADLQQNLYACVRVGRYDRAGALVRRLAVFFQPNEPEVIDAHHQYLVGVLEDLLLMPSKDKFQGIQQWFELEIRANNVLPPPSILAIMIKASLCSLEGTRLDRTIRRYLNAAQEQGREVLDDTVASEIFTDAEWSMVVRLCPDWYNAPPEEMKVDEVSDYASTLQMSQSPLQASTPIAQNPNIFSLSGQLPELQEAEQKGLGLRSLKKALGSMTDKQYEDDLAGDIDSELKTKYQRQRKLERDSLKTALEKWKEEAETTQELRNRGKITDPLLGTYVHQWVQDLTKIIIDEIEQGSVAGLELNDRNYDRQLLAPFLRLVAPERIAACTILAVISTFGEKPHKIEKTQRTVLFVASQVSNAVEEEVRAVSLRKQVLQKINTMPSSDRQRKLTKLAKQTGPKAFKVLRQEARKLAVLEDEDIGVKFTRAIQLKLGGMLISKVLDVAKLPKVKTWGDKNSTVEEPAELEPIITHKKIWVGGQRIGTLLPNPALIERLKQEPIAAYITKHLPMLVEPKRWTDVFEGGFLETKLSAIRFRDTSKAQVGYVEAASKRGDMKQVYEGMNVIGKVAWRINQPLLKVLSEAWNTGEAIGGLAPAHPVAEYPEEPDKADAKAHYRWKTLVRNIENEITGFHSQRCYQNFQLEVARAYADDTFYCPHNIDFRGRAYPIPPYFNHMGADYTRGLFTFADGKELGEIGLVWLKIHLANVYGYDKESLQAREQFAMDHLGDIYDSATRPLDGQKWWLTAGDPWQCLGACMELRNALESPVPSKFISHLPIHQDGTCNGLQHYAALGGDAIGARQVNLMPGPKPADIYTAVADAVRLDVEADAANGLEKAQMLVGKITRKIVKQPVMTNVYGVTNYGATQQVRKQLIDVMPKETLDNDINLGALAMYISNLIFKALGQMFNGSTAIQRWLGECGARISQSITPEQIQRMQSKRATASEGTSRYKRNLLPRRVRDIALEDYQFKSTIVWTTPLGLPVVQPYREAKYELIKTTLQDLRVMAQTSSDPVSKRRQLQAFPPNFIHSLDASHMMLSALKCDEIGLRFSAVHDSFWTHACDVPIMNRVLRDAFVRMHSENIIDRLREEFQARYRGCMHLVSIPGNSAAGIKIQELRRAKKIWKNAFKRVTVKEGPQVDELLEEYERLELLKSEDADQRARGEAMVTPGSLYAAQPVSESDMVALPEDEAEELRKQHEEEEASEEDVTASAVDETEELLLSQQEKKTFEGDDVEYLPGQEEESKQGHRRLVAEEGKETVLEGKALARKIARHAKERRRAEMEQRRVQRLEARAAKELAKEEKRMERMAKSKARLFLWLPLEFPPTPEKGTFHVAQLKESTYFFS